MVHYGLDSVQTSFVHYAVYGVACTEDRPQCIFLIKLRKKPQSVVRVVTMELIKGDLHGAICSVRFVEYD